MTKVRELIQYAISGWRRQAIMAGFVLLTLLVIAQLLYTNRDELSVYIDQSRPIFLVYAILFFLIDLMLALWAWHLLVGNFTSVDSFRLNSKINLSSNLAKRIPGSIWYVASRVALYQEKSVRKSQIVLLSALELALFICSGIVVALMTLPFWQLSAETFSELPATILFIIVAVIAIVLVNPRTLQAIWQRLSKDEKVPELSWQKTATWLIIYASTWVIGGCVLHSVINLFFPLPIDQLATSIGIWTLSGVVSLVGFISISLFGLREISLVLLLSQLMPISVAILVGIIIRLIWLSGELIFALLALKL